MSDQREQDVLSCNQQIRFLLDSFEANNKVLFAKLAEEHARANKAERERDEARGLAGMIRDHAIRRDESGLYDLIHAVPRTWCLKRALYEPIYSAVGGPRPKLRHGEILLVMPGDFYLVFKKPDDLKAFEAWALTAFSYKTAEWIVDNGLELSDPVFYQDRGAR